LKRSSILGFTTVSLRFHYGSTNASAMIDRRQDSARARSKPGDLPR
jgi:hypothetical protein